KPNMGGTDKCLCVTVAGTPGAVDPATRTHDLEAGLADRDATIALLRKRQKKLSVRAQLLAGELARLQEYHALVVNSRSWKLTRPLRIFTKVLHGEWGALRALVSRPREADAFASAGGSAYLGALLDEV